MLLLWNSGAALTAAQGLPDVGLATAADFARVIKEMVTVASLPILAGHCSAWRSRQLPSTCARQKSFNRFKPTPLFPFSMQFINLDKV